MHSLNEHVPACNDAVVASSVDLHTRIVHGLSLPLQNAFAYSWLTYVHIKHRIIRELCPVCTLMHFSFFALPPLCAASQSPRAALSAHICASSPFAFLPFSFFSARLVTRDECKCIFDPSKSDEIY